MTQCIACSDITGPTSNTLSRIIPEPHMKSFVLFVALFATAITHAEPEAADWTALSDGKTTKGWTPRGQLDSFDVVNGEFHLLTKKNVWVTSDLKLTNFILEAEAKVPNAAGVNGGIAFRCVGDKGKPKGYQCEIDPTARGLSAGLYRIGAGGWAFPTKDKTAAFATKSKKLFKQGDWNRYRIHCVGDHIRIYLNGELLTDVRDKTFKSGYFGIQHHGKGSAYKYRNIRVLDLGDNPGTATSKVKPKRPNIVFILADDMGYGDVHVLNKNSRIPTPHLDSLSVEGMTFTDAHSPSAVCTPTRYGTLTGRYCWRTRLKRGVLGGYSAPLIDAKRSTVATVMKRRGYHTAAIGKWHLGMGMPALKDKSVATNRWDGDGGIDFKGKIADGPTTRGFEYYFGVSASLDMAPYVWIENDGFTMAPTIQQPAVKFPGYVRKGPRAKDFIIEEGLDRIADKAVGYISDKSKAEKPFFLYMPLTAPHKPVSPHKRFQGKTKLGPYGDFIVQVDATVGRVLQAIDDAGIKGNTLVMFTSDNGSFMHRLNGEEPDHVSDKSIQAFRADHHTANGQFRGTKADVWEAGHHVPFFVRWPGVVKPKSSCDETICHVDLMATCAEITDTKLKDNEGEDSFSLLPLMKGHSWERAAVINHSAAGMFAIRNGKYKLVLGNGSGGREAPRGKAFQKPYQLFDLSKDIGERDNLIKKLPKVANDMIARFEKIHKGDRSR